MQRSKEFFIRRLLTSAATIDDMNICIYPDAEAANAAATECLAGWLMQQSVRNVMVAGGNTPIELYRRIAQRRLKLSHLNVFALDEYVGVPPDEPRNCANLLRRAVVEASCSVSARMDTSASTNRPAPRIPSAVYSTSIQFRSRPIESGSEAITRRRAV